MALREIEKLSGTGNIYVDGHLLRTTWYELSVMADDADGAQAEGSPQTIEGEIDISGMGEAVVLAGAKPLTLRLADGRRAIFTLTSSTGRIRVHGQLWPA